MKIVIAGDHRGFDIKNKIISFLESKSILTIDCGPYAYDPDDDYEDFVIKVIETMRKEKDSLGILICKNGVGVCITANKFKDIRCALSFEASHIASARIDDDANVLALPADFIEDEKIFEIVDTFINTAFGNEKRHIRRLTKLANLEKINFR